MSENPEEIVCKPTGWFLWRAVLMSVMFLGFGGYFYYDGKIGYKKKNVDFYNYSAKSRVKEFFKLAEVEKGNQESEAKSPAINEESWKKFAAEYEVKLFEKRDVATEATEITDVEGCFPDDYAFPQKLPQVFVDGYGEMAADLANVESIWKKYAADNGLSESCGEYFKPRGEIESQFKWAIGSGVLGLVALFFLFRTMGRSMRVNAEGFTPAGGKCIPFGAIHKIDKRKWKRKGLAYVFYKEDGSEEKKAKVDGMVYGQFDMENPHNAEALYQRIEASVKNVEIIDYEEDEDDEEEELAAEEEKIKADAEA